MKVASSLLVVSLFSSAFAASSGRHVSGDYLAKVNGRPVEVVRVPMPEQSGGCIGDRLAWQPYAYAAFTATGTVEVCVQSGFIDLSGTVILPTSKGVSPLARNANAVTFRMTPPMTLVLEPRGRHRALVVSANLPEANPPRKDDPKVKYFAPGFHRADEIKIGSGETLYLAPGAWVEGWLKTRGRDITVCGSGVLSGAAWNWGKGPRNEKGKLLAFYLADVAGENVTVRDVTFFSSWSWTFVLNSVTNALVDNVKVICGRVINDDGIDVCRGRDVVIRNSFVRCQDDCIAPKWWCENLVCTNLTLWTDAANAVRTGYECDDPKTGFGFRNHLFRDIDVLHLALNRRSPQDYWSNSLIFIQPSREQVFSDMLFEDLRLYEGCAADIFLNVKTMPIKGGWLEKVSNHPGRLKGLTLRDIKLPNRNGGPKVNLSAFDETHPIEGVRFENVIGYGSVTKSGPVDLVVR